MKTLFFLMILVPVSFVQAWIGKYVFIKGSIRSFDKARIEVVTETQGKLSVPREALDKDFKIVVKKESQYIPVLSSKFFEIKNR